MIGNGCGQLGPGANRDHSTACPSGGTTALGSEANGRAETGAGRGWRRSGCRSRGRIGRQGGGRQAEQ